MTPSEPGRIDPSGWDDADQTDPAYPRPAPSVRGSTDHCIFDSVRSVFFCERCKGEFAVKLPVDVMAFTGTAGAFMKLHEGCER